MKCVEEKPLDLNNWPARRPSIWHLTTTRATSDFAPIRCSKDEGIVFHGGVFDREPTCPDCRGKAGLPALDGEA